MTSSSAKHMAEHQVEAFDSVAYLYDGSPEGMLCAIF